MQTNVRVFVLEHLEEHGEEMGDCPKQKLVLSGIEQVCSTYSSLPSIGASPLICVPRAARTCCDGSETRSSMGGIISLSRVSRSIKLQKPSPKSELARNKTKQIHTWNLSCDISANFRFCILEELNKCGNHVARDHLFMHHSGNL